MSQSLVYKNIYLYRAIVGILYGGRYRVRFKDVTGLLDNNVQSVVDLCFGDVFIAEYCKLKNISWTGFDTNESFVKFAVKRGFNAFQVDVMTLDCLPKCDVCIISGALYHFHDVLYKLFEKMLASAKVLIVSEPIKNISSQKGVVGKIAAMSSNSGRGAESFRFTNDTFVGALDDLKKKLHFIYHIISVKRDILVKITHERN